MELYQKQVKYSLYEEVPSYGFNPDGYTDVLIEDTGWIAEEEDTWPNKGCGPYTFTETRWVKREERYVKIDAEPVVHARWDIRENPGCFDTYGNPDKHAHCTHCGFTWTDLYSVKNYFKCCPGCGAKMDQK